MEITLKDLIISDKFNYLKLIAGNNGLNNTITGCSILDYQFDKSLYINKPESFFDTESLVLTTFMYAKDNEFLILDALKRLIAKGVCGLAINNVYKLPISDIIIKTANSKNFPVFLFKNTDTKFENVILSINNSIEQLKNSQQAEHIIENIINSKNSYEDIYKLYPTIKNSIICTSFRLNENNNITFVKRFLTENLPENIDYTIFQYKNNALAIFSFDIIESSKSYDDIKSVLNSLNNDINIGISNMQNGINNISVVIKEALYASAFAAYNNTNLISYDSMGIYKLIFPYCQMESFETHKNYIIKQIESYDLLNNSNLMDTLVDYIVFKGNIHSLATNTCQHENTIRNRLDKIKNITGYDFKKPDDYAELSMVVKIHIAKQILNKYTL